ncbi:MAG: membrane protein insertion efficiency factor YidD [Bacteroidetes bacterium]|nr:membrane protein insertion efficiency factor YidD [Bacteroidota bacterium]MCA0444843.1 membrane protein insertion efficiency factor YidD [Bacteroidota bacterium]
MRTILIVLIKFYKMAISPYFPPTCRFTPTCSQYSIDALTKYGAFKGSVLSVKRIFRCHPFSHGGHDPVP